MPYTSEAEAVRLGAHLPDDGDSIRTADLALGNALVGLVQVYLAGVSDHWDVDLFFETYGRPPRDGGSWTRSIIDGLKFRRDISEDDRRALITASIAKAVEQLKLAG